jgi:hypothetical protein
MSDVTIEQAIDRIRSAEPESPILVHRSTVPWRIGTVFADTAETRRMLSAGELDVIGIWHKHSDLERVRSAIIDAIAQQADADWTRSKRPMWALRD